MPDKTLNLTGPQAPALDFGHGSVGGTMILGLRLTMDGRQGVEAVKLIRPKKVIPIHYNDYTVFKSPLEDFKQAVEAAGLSEQVIYLLHGETYNFEVALERAENR
jgi:L-ascorbate metabolism protein UlaG (beta-lactamase superfamily)